MVADSSSIAAEDSSFTRYGVYSWLESRAEITNVSYCMDSAIVPDRHSAAADSERIAACYPSQAGSGG